MSLNGKIALVTGGTRGIGREIALALAEEGTKVAITYTSSEDKALAVVDEIKGKGVEALAVKANVVNNDEVLHMVKEVEETLGTIDILINNAGITKDNLLIRMNEEDWDAVLDVNLKGVFLCTKAVARATDEEKIWKDYQYIFNCRV